MRVRRRETWTIRQSRITEGWQGFRRWAARRRRGGGGAPFLRWEKRRWSKRRWTDGQSRAKRKLKGWGKKRRIGETWRERSEKTRKDTKEGRQQARGRLTWHVPQAGFEMWICQCCLMNNGIGASNPIISGAGTLTPEALTGQEKKRQKGSKLT